jgi:hypothetical protein
MTFSTSEATNASSAEDVTMDMAGPFSVREATSAFLIGYGSIPSGPRSKTSGEISETLKLFQWLSLLQDTPDTRCTAVDRFPSSYLKNFSLEYNRLLFGGG